ncbi:hypothetical protein FRC03_005369 [Tulasnella sp. 419]|nr:hypothetical protein FRC03_005369 [Tulasnella sp. 419]
MAIPSCLHSTALAALDLLMKGVELEPLNQGDSLVSNIDRVDRQFNHLKYAAKTFQTVVKQQLVLNRHQRNALAPPIHRCPDEILVLIFEDLLISLKASYQLHQLRLVCRRWYEVTESNSVLWSYLVITSKTRRRQIDTHLAKSRSAPLTIDLDLDGGDTLDIIFDQIPRWRALALHERSRPKPGRSFGRIPAAPSNLHLWLRSQHPCSASWFWSAAIDT